MSGNTATRDKQFTCGLCGMATPPDSSQFACLCEDNKDAKSLSNGHSETTKRPIVEMHLNNSVKQFNFARNWRKKVAPHLSDSDVVNALTQGLRLFHPGYMEGDPPWLLGCGPSKGQKARRGCLSWYQPWGLSIPIAPFCWAIGRTIYPQLKWGFVVSSRHSVVIGYEDDWRLPKWVLDILCFQHISAAVSIELARQHGWHFCDSLTAYAKWDFDERVRRLLTKRSELGHEQVS